MMNLETNMKCQKGKLKRFSLLIIILFTHTLVQATVCIDKTFSHKNINLYLCQNHSNYNETRTLLFKARAQVLNQFIEDLITEKKLDQKKFEIQIWDGAIGYEHIMVSQSRNGYFVSCSGFPSFKELAKIINYFTQEEWTSFVYKADQVEDPERTCELFKKLLNQYPLPDLSKYISSKITLWQIDNLSLTYSKDSISYYDNNHALKYRPNSNLPIKIRDRYLFFQCDCFFVYQNGRELLKFKIRPIGTCEDYSLLKAHSTWVNIGFQADDILYSYSYDQNRFYDLSNS